MDKAIQEKLAQLLIENSVIKDKNFNFFSDTKQQEKLAQLFIQKGTTKDLADYNAMWQNALTNLECMEIVGSMTKDIAKIDKNFETLGDYIKALSQQKAKTEVKAVERKEADKGEQLKKEAQY